MAYNSFICDVSLLMFYQVTYFLFFRMIQSLALEKILVKFLLMFSHFTEPDNEYSHPNMVLNL